MVLQHGRSAPTAEAKAPRLAVLVTNSHVLLPISGHRYPLARKARLNSALPVRRWQARQWHTETRIWSPSAVARSWPQLQVAWWRFIPRSLPPALGG